MTRFLDWAFRSRETGRIVVGQAPNLTLSLFLAAGAVTWFADPAGTLGTVARVAGTAFLAVWAADELVRGVNPWRRFLGLAVLAYLAAQLIASA